MADSASPYGRQKDLTPEEQKKIGQAVPGAMGDEQTDFVKTISKMIQDGDINVFDIKTFFHPGAYEKLAEMDRGQVDLAMINIADLLRHIAQFYVSKQTPDASPQLEQMIEQLWQMKDKVEGKFGDILKF
ncbi:MAG: hypothetical protein PHW10_04185 [Candidatus Peribacteraceae bacterium]|nr:hypothetical protein [Candidatus Peribacteraceae bacterium]